MWRIRGRIGLRGGGGWEMARQLIRNLPRPLHRAAASRWWKSDRVTKKCEQGGGVGEGLNQRWKNGRTVKCDLGSKAYQRCALANNGTSRNKYLREAAAGTLLLFDPLGPRLLASHYQADCQYPRCFGTLDMSSLLISRHDGSFRRSFFFGGWGGVILRTPLSAEQTRHQKKNMIQFSQRHTPTMIQCFWLDRCKETHLILYMD